jgi:hypothetical protein
VTPFERITAGSNVSLRVEVTPVRHATTEQLEQAFEQAASARRKKQAPRGDALMASARRVLDLRDEALTAEPCPTPVLRRVQGWFAGRPRTLARRLLALVFDSGGSPVPAVRGALPAPRTLRYSSDGATVDVQVRGAAPKGRTLHLAVHPALPRLEVRVKTGRSGPGQRMTLDASGTGEVRLPAKAARIDASFQLGGVETFRIEGVRLS